MGAQLRSSGTSQHNGLFAEGSWSLLHPRMGADKLERWGAALCEAGSTHLAMLQAGETESQHARAPPCSKWGPGLAALPSAGSLPHSAQLCLCGHSPAVSVLAAACESPPSKFLCTNVKVLAYVTTVCHACRRQQGHRAGARCAPAVARPAGRLRDRPCLRQRLSCTTCPAPATCAPHAATRLGKTDELLKRLVSLAWPGLPAKSGELTFLLNQRAWLCLSAASGGLRVVQHAPLARHVPGQLPATAFLKDTALCYTDVHTRKRKRSWPHFTQTVQLPQNTFFKVRSDSARLGILCC